MTRAAHGDIERVSAGDTERRGTDAEGDDGVERKAELAFGEVEMQFGSVSPLALSSVGEAPVGQSDGRTENTDGLGTFTDGVARNTDGLAGKTDMRGRQTDGPGRATGGAERKSEVSAGLSSNLGDVSSVEGALVEPLLGDHETLRSVLSASFPQGVESRSKVLRRLKVLPDRELDTLRPRLPTDKGLSTRYIATGDRDDRGSGLAFLWGDSLSERAAMHMGDARGDPSDVDPRGDVPIDVRDAQGDSTAADAKGDTVGTDARDVLGERSVTEVREARGDALGERSVTEV